MSTQNTQHDPMEEFFEELQSSLASIEDEQERLRQMNELKRQMYHYRGEDEVVLSPELRRIVAEEQAKHSFAATTGFPTMDSAIEGFRPGNLVVVSAPTGVGKTTFCQSLTERFYEQGILSLWFSYEVGMAEMLEKFSEDLIFAAPKQLTGDTTKWIEKRIIEAKVKTTGKSKYGCRAVFIDHLHFIVSLEDLSKGTNMSVLIGKTVAELKKIAEKWQVVIFLVSHLKKTRFDEMPDLSDLRDSSFIAQYADIVVMMVRQMEEVVLGGESYQRPSNRTAVAIQKHRRTGKTGTFLLQYNDGTLDEVTEDYEHVY